MTEIGEPRVKRDRVLHRPMGHLVESGEERGAGRPTGCRLGQVVPEGHALSAQPVDVGDIQQLIAEPRQGIAAPLINNDQEHVFARVQGATPS